MPPPAEPPAPAVDPPVDPPLPAPPAPPALPDVVAVLDVDPVVAPEVPDDVVAAVLLEPVVPPAAVVVVLPVPAPVVPAPPEPLPGLVGESEQAMTVSPMAARTEIPFWDFMKASAVEALVEESLRQDAVSYSGVKTRSPAPDAATFSLAHVIVRCRRKRARPKSDLPFLLSKSVLDHEMRPTQKKLRRGDQKANRSLQPGGHRKVVLCAA